MPTRAAPSGRYRGRVGIFIQLSGGMGPGGKTLFITDSETGTILSAKLDVAGKEMYSHM